VKKVCSNTSMIFVSILLVLLCIGMLIIETILAIPIICGKNLDFTTLCPLFIIALVPISFIILSIWALNRGAYKVLYDKEKGVLCRKGFICGFKLELNVKTDIKGVATIQFFRGGEYYVIVDVYNNSYDIVTKKSYIALERNEKNLEFIRQFWDEPIRDLGLYLPPYVQNKDQLFELEHKRVIMKKDGLNKSLISDAIIGIAVWAIGIVGSVVALVLGIIEGEIRYAYIVTLVVFVSVELFFVSTLNRYACTVTYDKEKGVLYRKGYWWGYKLELNVEKDIKEIVTVDYSRIGTYFVIVDVYNNSFKFGTKRMYMAIQKNDKNLEFIRQFWDKPIRDMGLYLPPNCQKY